MSVAARTHSRRTEGYIAPTWHAIHSTAQSPDNEAAIDCMDVPPVRDQRILHRRAKHPHPVPRMVAASGDDPHRFSCAPRFRVQLSQIGQLERHAPGVQCSSKNRRLMSIASTTTVPCRSITSLFADTWLNVHDPVNVRYAGTQSPLTGCA